MPPSPHPAAETPGFKHLRNTHGDQRNRPKPPDVVNVKQPEIIEKQQDAGRNDQYGDDHTRRRRPPDE